MKKVIILIISFSLGFLISNFFANKAKEKMVTKFENNASAVRNAFKVGCELAYLKNDLEKDSNFCEGYLNKNSELLRLLIDKNKIKETK